MITLGAGVRIWVAAGVTDMRRGFDGLAAMVQQQLGHDPFSGALFIFRGRRGHLLKILAWGGQGLVLYAKRLERGQFVWPQAKDGVVSLTPAQLSMLTEGIDWRMPARSWQPEMVGQNPQGLWQFYLARRRSVGDPVIMLDTDAAPLPTDVATLQAMVLARAAELVEIRTARQVQDAALAAARAGIIEQRFEIEALKARLAKLLRATFGRSSEKLRDQVEQLELTLAEIDEMLAETAPPDEPADAGAPASTSKGRRPLPEALPREIVTYAAPCSCPACGGVLRPLGEDVTEILEYVPGSFRVVRHVRPKLSCRACETIAQAPAPSLPISPRPRGARPARPCVGGEILRPPATAQAGRNLRPRGHRSQPVDAG